MITLVIAALVAGAALAAPTPAAGTETTPTPPAVSFVGAPSDRERAMVVWGMGRFVAAGLQLPDVTVSFPAVCRGADGRALAGRYLVGRGEIELCRPSRRLAVHELAHAWDDGTNLDRPALLEQLQLDHWYEQPGRRSTDSGGEQLALIVTWGLMDVDLAHPVPAWAGQPLAQQPRSLPGMPGRTTADLARLFERITDTTPLSPSATSASDVCRRCSDGSGTVHPGGRLGAPERPFAAPAPPQVRRSSPRDRVGDWHREIGRARVMQRSSGREVAHRAPGISGLRRTGP